MSREPLANQEFDSWRIDSNSRVDDNNKLIGGEAMSDRASFVSGRRRRPRIFPIQLVASIVCLYGFMQVATAGQVTVQVSKRGAGQPVRAAAVCLGTPANPAQFGAVLADEKGIAQFDKVRTRTELVLTVSKSGYKGRQIALGSDPRDRGVLLTLSSGGGGPRCTPAVGSAPAASAAAFMPGIAEFRINGGAPKTRSKKVRLDFVLTGEASHYRASDRSDFESAEWHPIEEDLRLELAGKSGMKTIYFQVGKFTSAEGVEMEMLSNIAVDSIELEGG